MKSIEIKILAKDIKLGERCEPCYCPVALAVNRAIKSKKGIYIDGSCIELYDKEWREIQLPEKAKKFINQFDHGKSVKPINFTITF